jgi:DNA-binding protein H-NS
MMNRILNAINELEEALDHLEVVEQSLKKENHLKWTQVANMIVDLKETLEILQEGE